MLRRRILAYDLYDKFKSGSIDYVITDILSQEQNLQIIRQWGMLTENDTIPTPHSDGYDPNIWGKSY